MRISPGRARIGALVGLGCAVVILGPSLAPGFLLHYDMVFVPRLPLSDRTLGIDGSVPRAVPNDLVVALLSLVLPGWIVQKLLLVTVFVGAAAGAATLSRTRLSAAVAALVVCWNPFVAERLAIGHWGYLLGYAALPWVALAAARGRRRWLALALVAAAASGSTGAVWAVGTAVAVVLARPDRRPRQRATDVGLVLGVSLLANAPWWWPYLALAPSTGSASSGVGAFAARADTPWGTLGSLASGGGIWNSAVWFGERTSWLVSGVALLAVAGILLRWFLARGWREHPALPGLAVAAAVGLLVAWLGAVTPGLSQFVVAHVPGGGLVRDSQKFVAPWMVLVAVATGAAAASVLRAVVKHGGPPAIAWVLAGLLGWWSVFTLPGLAWGAHGRWTTAQYPAELLQVATKVDSLHPHGSVAVFPWNQYRRFAWNGDRVLLDPWQRLLARDVLVNDSLPLRGGGIVPGESPRAAAITAAVGTGRLEQVLRSEGVRYVVLLSDQRDRTVGEASFPGAREVAVVTGVTVLDLGPPTAGIVAQPRWWAWAGLVAFAAAFAVSVVGCSRDVGYMLYTGRARFGREVKQ